MKREKGRRPLCSASSRAYAETLLDDLQLLLGDLCLEWGFCNALAGEILPKSGIITADDLAKAVLAAEGWPADVSPHQWLEAMRKVFEARYGTWTSSSAYEQRVRG